VVKDLFFTSHAIRAGPMGPLSEKVDEPEKRKRKRGKNFSFHAV
jgi:hypothetical protein